MDTSLATTFVREKVDTSFGLIPFSPPESLFVEENRIYSFQYYVEINGRVWQNCFSNVVQCTTINQVPSEVAVEIGPITDSSITLFYEKSEVNDFKKYVICISKAPLPSDSTLVPSLFEIQKEVTIQDITTLTVDNLTAGSSYFLSVFVVDTADEISLGSSIAFRTALTDN